MTYREQRPAEELTPWVQCIWELQHAPDSAPTSAEPQRVFPDGSIELIFHRGQCFSVRTTDGAVTRQPRSLLYGQIRRFVELLPPPEVCTIGVRFHPAGAARFFDLSLDEITDRWISLDDAWGPTDLEARVLEACSTDSAITEIERFLLDRLDRESRQPSPTTPDPIVRAVDAIRAHHGRLRIRDLVSQFGLSERQFERRFRREVGLTPKQLATIERLQGAFRWIGREPSASLTEAAHACGYHDQSHFIRDFRRLTGLNPTRFYRGGHEIAQLFVGD